MSNIPVNSLLESELESRFIEALRRSKYHEQPFQLKQDVVNGKPGWMLTADERLWQIEPQVELGSKDNVAISGRADFVFYPQRSGQTLPIAVFTDGFMFHAEGENHRIGYDIAQRMALLRSRRFNVWSLTWDDVEDRFKSTPESSFENFLNHSVTKLGKLLATHDLNCMLESHERRSFDLLVSYLATPDSALWAKYAAISALAMPSIAMISELDADNLRKSVLGNGDVVLPISGGVLFAGALERNYADDTAMLQLCTISSKESATKGDPAGIECIVRLFDGNSLACFHSFLLIFYTFQVD